VLGFNILYARPEDKFVFLEREGAQLMLEQIGVGRNWLTAELKYPFGRGINLQIKTNEVATLYEQVQADGHPIFSAKWYRRDDKLLGNRQFLIQDPDGYLLRFFEDLGSRPAPP